MEYISQDLEELPEHYQDMYDAYLSFKQIVFTTIQCKGILDNKEQYLVHVCSEIYGIPVKRKVIFH